MEERCEKTDLLTRDCAHCQKHELGDEVEPQKEQFGGLLRKYYIHEAGEED